MINVKTAPYSAAGNGAADDTAAIQAAVNAAVAEDRDDLIHQLVEEYPDAALEIMSNEAA